ncbi:YcaO-like family protein [Streptomyces sp. NPDC059552]|uniref:YcaO-like family protein n=1 Tax=Streptomyces sp. NPDC059552 TaxID=3346862 RepID=UPI0036D1C34F
MEYQAGLISQQLSGVLSPPQPGQAFWGAQHTVVVSVGAHQAVAGIRQPVDGLGGGEVVHGAASDADPALAVLKAQMEALERYASLVGVEARSVVASSAELGPAALPPHTLPRHAVAEPGRRAGTHGVLAPTDRIRWVDAKRCSDGANVFVPAIMAYNVSPRLPGEDFWIPISTGTAAHFSIDQATENAVLEVVERDALALTWLLRTPGRQLSWAAAEAGPGPEARRLRSLALAEGYALSCWDITSDIGIPTVLSLLQGQGPVVHHVVGAAARRTVAAAADASVSEAVQICASLDAAVRTGDRAPRTPVRCRRIHDGALFMAAADRAHHFEFLGTPEAGDVRTRGLAACPPRASLVERVLELGHEVYIVDLTPPDVAPAGVRVVRAIVPSLQPLSSVYAARYLASDRLRQTASPLTQLNTMPYPLA